MRSARYLFVVVFAVAVMGVSMSWAAPDFAPLPNVDKNLTPENTAKLENGEVVKFNTVTKDEKGNDRGKGVAMVIIHASKEKILAAIEDYPTYPAWMPNTKSTKITNKQGDRVDVEFTLKIMGFTVLYTCIHRINEAAGTVEWRMDDAKPKENVKDSVGAWVIKPIGDNKCIVAYTVAVDTGVSIPKFIQDALTNSSLPKVVKSVRTRVEGK